MPDYELTYIIPEDKVQEFKDWFLLACPNPFGSEMSDVEWIRYKIRRDVLSTIQLGKIVESHDSVTEEDDDIIS